MVFSVGIGSKGCGPESYSLRLPFVMSPGKSLALAGDGQFELFGFRSELAIERSGQYVLTVSGFNSDGDASRFVDRICAGLVWFGLNTSAGLKFRDELSRVDLLPEPKSIKPDSFVGPIADNANWQEYDGHYDADKTIVRPDHKRLFVFDVGSVTVRTDTSVSSFAGALIDGMSVGRPELVMKNQKLLLACNQYLASHFESTPAAGFLNQVTTLEILVPNLRVSESVQQLIEKFMKEAESSKSAAEDDATQTELASVLGQLSRMRNRSIKSGIQYLIEDCLKNDPDTTDPSAIAREVAQIYDLRSTLVHTGSADTNTIAAANGRLRDIVPRVLRTLFRETATA